MKTYGKLILIGEHSVVYGHPAIAIPFTGGMVETTVSPSQSWVIDSNLFHSSKDALHNDHRHLKALIDRLQEALDLPPLRLKIESSLPVAAGLGSSAALATSITKAIFEYKDISISEQQLFDYVQYAEQIAHGNASGIDALITITNNAYLFTKDGTREIRQLSFDGFLIIGNSNETSSTKQAVSNVKNKYDQGGKSYINQLGKLTKAFDKALTLEDIIKLGQIMDEAERNLAKLGLETKTLQTMIQLAKSSGALGAKLTGAGLGGCVIALTDQSDIAQTVKDKWEDAGFSSWIMNMKEAI